MKIMMSLRGLFPGVSLEEKMAAAAWKPSGFDYMRLIFSICIIFSHAKIICYGAIEGNRLGYGYMDYGLRFVVPAFFALSGFLVAGSLERSRTMLNFVGLRVFRIIPALFVEVILSALILGPLCTTLPLHEYYTDPEFRLYFLNILGYIHYNLPGVFLNHPSGTVNIQLWTIPYELICYMILSVFAVLGIFKNRKSLLIVVSLCLLMQILNSALHPDKDENLMISEGFLPVFCFISGVVLYRWRDKIAWSGILCATMIALVWVICAFLSDIRLCALPLSYVTIYFGLFNPPRNRILLSGDYSYGIYLYGWPLQQALLEVSPIFQEWRMNFIGAAVCASLLAVFSWWAVERPVLSRRDILKKLEAIYLSWPVSQKFRSLEVMVQRILFRSSCEKS